MSTRFTWHGGGLTSAISRFGGKPEDWLDLSTGINPRSWPGVEALDIDWARLPDEHELRLLEQTAAHFFGCNLVNVCALPGTEPGLRMIGNLIGGPAFYRTPCYSTHSVMVKDAAPISHARLDEADASTLILANPNNPDGELLDRNQTLQLLERRGPEGWLVVDEAFAECTAETSVAADVQDDRRLVVLRSFGKFFGLAGVRLGFLLGPQHLIADLRKKLGAWPLSAAAIRIGIAAYQDQPWIAATGQQLVEGARLLDIALQKAGFEPQGACPLFRLITCEDAHLLFEQLACAHILTRPFVDNPHWLRIGLPGSNQGLKRLQQALAHG